MLLSSVGEHCVRLGLCVGGSALLHAHKRFEKRLLAEITVFSTKVKHENYLCFCFVASFSLALSHLKETVE
jgi:hypothetical protein